MPTLTIDNKTITVPEGTNVLEAAKGVDIVIPHFCYHEALGAVGACRLCAMDFVDGPVKGMQMSCMVKAQDGMVVSTLGERSVDLRKHVIEWLMINHPHDCPVCDEGGECQLQDMTVAGGHGIRRFERPQADLRQPVSGALRLSRDEPLHPVLSLRAHLPGLLRRHRFRRPRLQPAHLFRPLPRRHAGEPLLRQHRRRLPDGGVHRQDLPLPGPLLGPGGGAFGLPALLPGLRRHPRRPLPGTAAGARRGQPADQRLFHLRPGALRLRPRQPSRAAPAAAPGGAGNDLAGSPGGGAGDAWRKSERRTGRRRWPCSAPPAPPWRPTGCCGSWPAPWARTGSLSRSIPAATAPPG